MVVLIVLAPSGGRSRSPGNAFVKIAILPQPSYLKPAEGPESRDPRTDRNGRQMRAKTRKSCHQRATTNTHNCTNQVSECCLEKAQVTEAVLSESRVQPGFTDLCLRGHKRIQTAVGTHTPCWRRTWRAILLTVCKPRKMVASDHPSLVPRLLAVVGGSASAAAA